MPPGPCFGPCEETYNLHPRIPTIPKRSVVLVSSPELEGQISPASQGDEGIRAHSGIREADSSLSLAGDGNVVLVHFRLQTRRQESQLPRRGCKKGGILCPFVSGFTAGAEPRGEPAKRNVCARV